MSTAPLRVTVISAEHIGHLPEIPVVSRTALSSQSSHLTTALDELRLDSDFWTSDWRANLTDCLQSSAFDNSVGYVVPGHPMLGDSTMQHLLEEDSAGRIDLELFDEPLPVILTEILTISTGPPVFIDALNLIEIAREAPFSAGALPTHSGQSIVVTNVIPGAVGSILADLLQRRFRASTDVKLIPMLGEPEQAELTLSELENESTGYPCYLVLPPVGGDAFQRTADDLQRIIARLRAPGGCPWDREQTNVTLSRNLIEESYELLDAIESGNSKAVREELGDFLLQAMLHSQITEEAGRFTFEDIVETLVDKLIRRHPHVFANENAANADDVVQSWDEIKRAERAARPGESTASMLGDIPASLPALMRAQSIIKRSGRTSLSASQIEQLNDEAHATFDTEDERRVVAQILDAVQNAQELGIDAEQVVRNWTRSFERALTTTTHADD